MVRISGFYNPSVNENDYCLEYRLKDPIKYDLNEETKIIFLPKFNAKDVSVESEDIRLEQSKWINIENENPKSMDEIMDILTKVLNLVRLGSRKRLIY